MGFWITLTPILIIGMVFFVGYTRITLKKSNDYEIVQGVLKRIKSFSKGLKLSVEIKD